MKIRFLTTTGRVYLVEHPTWANPAVALAQIKELGMVWAITHRGAAHLVNASTIEAVWQEPGPEHDGEGNPI